jgi:hypothetical protein
MPLSDEDSSDAAVGMDGSSMVDIDKNDERLRTHGGKRKMGATGLGYRSQRRRFHLHKGCKRTGPMEGEDRSVLARVFTVLAVWGKL